MSKVTLEDMKKFWEDLEKPGLKVFEGLAISRAFRDKHNLSDKETLDIANKRF